MLGEINNALPSLQNSFNNLTFLSIYILYNLFNENLFNDKRGINTRFNGENFMNLTFCFAAFPFRTWLFLALLRLCCFSLREQEGGRLRRPSPGGEEAAPCSPFAAQPKGLLRKGRSSKPKGLFLALFKLKQPKGVAFLASSAGLQNLRFCFAPHPFGEKQPLQERGCFSPTGGKKQLLAPRRGARRFYLAASTENTESENNESSENTDNSIQNDSVPNRLAPRQLPGVYMILCLANNKRYYGESKNLSIRLSQHKSRLRKNMHENLELQRDFNLYGENNFEFSCIYISRNCSKDERVAMEMELIGRNKSICYNIISSINRQKENNPFPYGEGRTHTQETRQQISKSLSENRQNSSLDGFPVSIKGQVYPSISEASRQTNHSRDTIRRWLNDPNKKDCIPVDASKPSGNSTDFTQDFESQDPLVANTGFPKSVSIYGVIYKSIGEAAKQRNCSRTNILRLLRNHPDNCFLVQT